MILNKEGKHLWINDVKYAVGDKVIATNESEYEGLIGKIIEIRDGSDMETDNDGPDIYCCFEEPVMAVNKEKLKKRFSELWQQPMEIENINLDQAIMAPDMIKPLNALRYNKDRRTLYILVEDAAVDGNESVNIDAFTDYEEAKRHLEIKLNNEIENGMLLTPVDSREFDVDETEDSYEIYRKGRYCEWHYSVCIKKYETDLSDDFIADIGSLYVNHIFAEDFVAQIEDWEEFADFSEEEYESFINNPEIPNRIREELRNDESFMSDYICAVSEIAHKIVDEEVKKRMETNE